MQYIFCAIGISVSIFIIMLIINKGKGTKKIVTNIGSAVVAGVLTYVIAGNTPKQVPKPTITPTPTLMPTATTAAVPKATAAVPNTKEDKNILVDFDGRSFMNSYLTDMTSAINNNDFTLVKKYLKADSDAYVEQESYISDYCQKKSY